MSDQEKRLVQERDAIAARVARFREMQQKFARERNDYFVSTLESAVDGRRPPSQLRTPVARSM